jgi:hypothetical protein
LTPWRRTPDADVRDAAAFREDWKALTPQQQGTFRKVVKDAFVPDLMARTGRSGRACASKA